jgi:transcriptional antiterminator RfaH
MLSRLYRRAPALDSALTARFQLSFPHKLLISCHLKKGNILEKKTNPSWYALYTKSRAEKKVHEDLKNQGIEVYLPLKREQRQWSDRKKWVEVPVISSYIFIKINPSQYRDVFNAPGVVAYVSHKGQAVAIPEREIEAMRRTVENKLSFSVESDKLKKGEKVTITNGPLKGIEGEVEEIQGTKKLYLRISHIGYMLVLNLDEVERNG